MPSLRSMSAARVVHDLTALRPTGRHLPPLVQWEAPAVIATSTATTRGGIADCSR